MSNIYEPEYNPDDYGVVATNGSELDWSDWGEPDTGSGNQGGSGESGEDTGNSGELDWGDSPAQTSATVSIFSDGAYCPHECYILGQDGMWNKYTPHILEDGIWVPHSGV